MQWHSQVADWTTGKLSLLSPRARLLAVVVVLLAGLLCVLMFSQRPVLESEFLLGGRTFSLAEIAAIEAALAKAGLAESDVVGDRIRIPTEKKNEYLQALADGGALPGGIDPDWSEYVPESPFPSRELVEQKTRHAQQQKLARIIQAMHGIESATVNYDEMKKAGFPPTVEKRAVVVVRAEQGRHLSFDQIEAIRATVAGYVSGLDGRQVTVTDLNAVRAYPGDLDSQLAGQPYSTASWLLEKAYREKILKRLEMYPGVVVGVNAQWPLAGAAADLQVASQAAAASPGPALLTASIDLPRTHLSRIWRERNPQAESPPDAEQLAAVERELKQSVQRAVAALLPPPAPEWAAFEQVTVTSYDDVAAADQPSLAAEPVSANPAELPPWLLWLAGAAVVAVALMTRLLRGSATRSRDETHANDSPVRAVIGGEPSEHAAAAEPPNKAAHWQQELVRTVQHDPEAAAKALQRWIKSAA